MLDSTSRALQKDSTRSQSFNHGIERLLVEMGSGAGAYHGSSCRNMCTCSVRTVPHDLWFPTLLKPPLPPSLRTTLFLKLELSSDGCGWLRSSSSELACKDKSVTSPMGPVAHLFDMLQFQRCRIQTLLKFQSLKGLASWLHSKDNHLFFYSKKQVCMQHLSRGQLTCFWWYSDKGVLFGWSTAEFYLYLWYKYLLPVG